MRALRIIDLGVQTFLLGATALAMIFIVFSGGIETMGIAAMYGAFFLGPWQLVSSLITTLRRRMFLKWRVIHLVSSIVYLTVISVVAAYFGRIDFNIVVTALGFMIPAGLAFFYYYITVMTFRAS